jgi:hypothetical protein
VFASTVAPSGPQAVGDAGAGVVGVVATGAGAVGVDVGGAVAGGVADVAAPALGAPASASAAHTASVALAQERRALCFPPECLKDRMMADASDSRATPA